MYHQIPVTSYVKSFDPRNFGVHKWTCPICDCGHSSVWEDEATQNAPEKLIVCDNCQHSILLSNSTISLYGPQTDFIASKVIAEMQRQDLKWGEQNHNGDKWMSIIGEEYGEMCKAVNEFGFQPTPEIEQEIYDEAIQTAACCMQMCLCIDRMRENPPTKYRRNSDYVDAWQVGNPNPPDWVLGFDLFDNDHTGGTMHVMTSAGSLIITKGDYLVRTKNGDFNTYTKLQFREEFSSIN